MAVEVEGQPNSRASDNFFFLVMLGKECWLYGSDRLNSVLVAFQLEIVALPWGAAEGNLTWGSASRSDGPASGKPVEWADEQASLCLVFYPQAMWAWSRNVKSSCRWVTWRITESRCQSGTATLQCREAEFRELLKEKKKDQKTGRTVETVICKMPEYLVPALQGWAYFLWNCISCPPAFFTSLGPA